MDVEELKLKCLIELQSTCYDKNNSIIDDNTRLNYNDGFAKINCGDSPAVENKVDMISLSEFFNCVLPEFQKKDVAGHHSIKGNAESSSECKSLLEVSLDICPSTSQENCLLEKSVSIYDNQTDDVSNDDDQLEKEVFDFGDFLNAVVPNPFETPEKRRGRPPGPKKPSKGMYLIIYFYLF